ncbi:MAG: mechanosensitive ion channel family protein [Bacteriovoracaceae bacterium]|nr:mechanosensitive ion channel family protein [Bacteriovoracaceae bacterium]
MPNILEKLFYQNTFTDWVTSIGIVVASLILGKIIFWIFKSVFKKAFSKTKTKLDDILVDMLDEPFVFGMVAWGIHIGLSRLKFHDSIHNLINNFMFGFISLMGTWFVARCVSAAIDLFLVPIAEKTDSDFDDHLLPIIKKSSNLGIWALGIIVGLNNAGFDVGALIAGMGIGGLALAMAAKDTVSNFFGGVTVFVDKPFKIHDRIKINGIDGTVIEIGLRSTRIKTLERRIVTIPNAKFADGIVENVTLEPHRKVILNLGLMYDTTPEQMKSAMSYLKDIIDTNPKTYNDDVFIGFNSWGDFSLGILVIYYINKDENYLEVQTEVNLAILEKFNSEGLGFAFPTQTLDIPKENLNLMDGRS